MQYGKSTGKLSLFLRPFRTERQVFLIETNILNLAGSTPAQWKDWLSVPDHPRVKLGSLAFRVQLQDQVFLFYPTLFLNLPDLFFRIDKWVEKEERWVITAQNFTRRSILGPKVTMTGHTVATLVPHVTSRHFFGDSIYRNFHSVCKSTSAPSSELYVTQFGGLGTSR